MNDVTGVISIIDEPITDISYRRTNEWQCIIANCDLSNFSKDTALHNGKSAIGFLNRSRIGRIMHIGRGHEKTA